MTDSQFKSPDEFLSKLEEKNPYESNFLQTADEIVKDVWEFLQEHPEYLEANILSRLVEPERTVIFRVPWIDDKGIVQVNRGFRVQFNSAKGPYKGGLRFHPSVNLDILKFLGFEQVFKNTLTGLPLGGGKGGSDFNPKGKSDNEVMRFCQSFMTELSRHIGADTDVPAGDIGVGAREVGYLFGQYRRLRNEFTGVLTGKPVVFGGSLLRTEATGYGVCYFTEHMLKQGSGSKGSKKSSKSSSSPVSGKSVLISGSGNVALHAAEKMTQVGAKVLTLSDSGGTIHYPKGLDQDKIDFLKELKMVKRGRLSEVPEQFKDVEYLEGKSPWSIKGDIALPCATQNEISGEDAKALLKNGVICVCEGANMPSTPEAVQAFLDAKIMFGPAKAANAGGVGVSGLEMSQNSMRTSWTREEVDEKLRGIMVSIHSTCVEFGQESESFVNYVRGANVGAFQKIASAMLQQGAV